MEASKSSIVSSSQSKIVGQFEELTPQDIDKLATDKTKARKYIQSCKGIIKKQTEELKKQQKEFKKAVANLEAQSFTSKFHAVAFRLEMDVMRMIQIRRKQQESLSETIITGRAFTQWFKHIGSSVQEQQLQLQIRIQSAQYILRSILKIRRNKLRILKATRFYKWKTTTKTNERLFKKVHKLRREHQQLNNMLQDAQTQNLSGGQVKVQSLVKENEALRQKIENAELSVGQFVSEMQKLLNNHDVPKFVFGELRNPDIRKRAFRGRLRNKPGVRSPERSVEKKRGKSHRIYGDY